MTDKELIQDLRCSGSPAPHCQETCPFFTWEDVPADLSKSFGGAEIFGSCDCDGIVMRAADRMEALLTENATLRLSARLLRGQIPLPSTEGVG